LTEQWFMIRTGGQMKEKTTFPVFDDTGRDKKRNKGAGGVVSKVKRLDREVDYLFGSGERTTLVDISGEAKVNGQPVGSDPNTYTIHEAFVDPSVIDAISFRSPRNGKPKTVDVGIKPGTTCEVRTNFKRLREHETVIFCTALNGTDGMKKQWTMDLKARKFMSDFDEQISRMKMQKDQHKKEVKEAKKSTK
jgi:hypothetical protein